MVLAAGEGLRLRPLTERLPKSMIRVGGKPVLEHTLAWLRRHGVAEVLINLYHRPEAIREHFGDGARLGMRIVYSREDRMLGTAGGVKNAAWFFRGPFLLLYGDNLSTCDFSRLLAFHRRCGGLATLALFEREDATSSGIAQLGPDGRITRFLEKPSREQCFSHLVNAGIYVLEPELLNWIPAEGAPDFGRDVFPYLLAAGQPIYGYRMPEDERLWWMDTPQDLERLQMSWPKERAG